MDGSPRAERASNSAARPCIRPISRSATTAAGSTRRSPTRAARFPPRPERRLWLDLGEVQAFARVKVNGKDFGLLWKPPFLLDVTDAVSAGENRLEVGVTNLWPNRMIGDEQLPEDSLRNPDGTLKRWPDWLRQGKPSPTGRQTFTTWRLWKKSDPLLKSGLLGPVRLVPTERIPLPR